MAIVNSGSLLCVYPKTKCLIAKASTVGSRVDIPSTIMECQAVTAVPSTGACDDASLVNAARQGDRAAFGRLYEGYARMVHGILLTRVPPGEVDDLVQDVFVLALDDLAENGVLPGKPTGRRKRDEKLRSVGVRP